MTNDQKLTLRLSQQDMALLRTHTAKTRLSQSAYLRMLVRGLSPKAYPPEPFYELLAALRQIGSALTSIAATMKTHGGLDCDRYEAVVQQLFTTMLRFEQAVTAPEEINGYDIHLERQG